MSDLSTQLNEKWQWEESERVLPPAALMVAPHPLPPGPDFWGLGLGWKSIKPDAWVAADTDFWSQLFYLLFNFQHFRRFKIFSQLYAELSGVTFIKINSLATFAFKSNTFTVSQQVFFLRNYNCDSQKTCKKWNNSVNFIERLAICTYYLKSCKCIR
jgi:hypothetical protein